jgi:hypothetical protein
MKTADKMASEIVDLATIPRKCRILTMSVAPGVVSAA